MHTVLLEASPWALLPPHSWFCMRECSIVCSHVAELLCIAVPSGAQY